MPIGIEDLTESYYSITQKSAQETVRTVPKWLVNLAPIQHGYSDCVIGHYPLGARQGNMLTKSSHDVSQTRMNTGFQKRVVKRASPGEAPMGT